MKKRKKSKIYFGQEVQDAIVEYNKTDDDRKRSLIYEKRIHMAFDKLVENIINTFKFSYFDDVYEDVKNEVISAMVVNMHKFDHTLGFKAFSYFSMIAKNYLILANNSNYKKYKTHNDISVAENFLTDNSNFNDGYFNDLIDESIKYFNYNIPKIFNKQKDIDIAYAIVDLMEQREIIENFNKKSIYVLIREMTNYVTADITRVVNVLKIHYKKILCKFEEVGIVEYDSNNGYF